MSYSNQFLEQQDYLITLPRHVPDTWLVTVCTLAQNIMEALPQVRSVTIGSGMAVDNESGLTTLFRRHRYQCDGSWVVLVLEGPCECYSRVCGLTHEPICEVEIQSIMLRSKRIP